MPSHHPRAVNFALYTGLTTIFASAFFAFVGFFGISRVAPRRARVLLLAAAVYNFVYFAFWFSTAIDWSVQVWREMPLPSGYPLSLSLCRVVLSAPFASPLAFDMLPCFSRVAPRMLLLAAAVHNFVYFAFWFSTAIDWSVQIRRRTSPSLCCVSPVSLSPSVSCRAFGSSYRSSSP